MSSRRSPAVKSTSRNASQSRATAGRSRDRITLSRRGQQGPVPLDERGGEVPRCRDEVQEIGVARQGGRSPTLHGQPQLGADLAHRVGEHQAQRPLAMPQGEGLRHLAAVRNPEHVRAAHAERVEKRGKVVCVLCHRVRRGRMIGLSLAAAVGTAAHGTTRRRPLSAEPNWRPRSSGSRCSARARARLRDRATRSKSRCHWLERLAYGPRASCPRLRSAHAAARARGPRHAACRARN